MLTKKFHFKVPDNLIALNPIIPRNHSKLVEVSNEFKIRKFDNLINLLKSGDCLIINDTKVIPAELSGFLKTSFVKITLNKKISDTENIWRVFAKPQRKLKENLFLKFSENFEAKVLDILKDKNGEAILDFNCSDEVFFRLLKKNAKLALPNYISKRRAAGIKDHINYQSIFAERNGAVAAPTASLHFSQKLIIKLIKKGIKIIKVTLHVNGGTFVPINKKNIDDHHMHFEYGVISKKAASLINLAKKKGKKCIAVGTTVLRLLESSKNKDGTINSFEGETNIFIKPGWKVNSVDGLITNFHTPKSTLFVLICSLIGIKRAKQLYSFAVKEKIRFYSYGDACLIWTKS